MDVMNFNIGLLGHVDTGKTTLARALSGVAGTAAFDKSPQSRERGITLDLGFSALLVKAPSHIAEDSNVNQLQLTFVDCPGHASLIRTVIGGAQIVDMVILVVDALKGIQTQTAECIVIGELLSLKLVIAVNKIDMLEEFRRDLILKTLHTNLRKTMNRTAFGSNVSIYNISAHNGIGIDKLLDGIRAEIYVPSRNIESPFVIYVDHCFSVKGQGSVCTGTIIQGMIKVNNLVEIPAINEQRKVKSIQRFKNSVQSARAGDRIGICLTQFNSKLLERGLLSHPMYLKPIYAACISFRQIPHYKQAIKSKTKFHVTVGHGTVMAQVTLFRKPCEGCVANTNFTFHIDSEYEYVDKIEPTIDASSGQVFALFEFESPILAMKDALFIASRLDMDVNTKSCRLAFWGHMLWLTHSASYIKDILSCLKVFKYKSKEGFIQRVVNDKEVIVRNLFTKAGNRDSYIGKSVTLSTGEVGVITSSFGQGSKVKIQFINGIKANTMDMLKRGNMSAVIVHLRFKKYIFNK